MKHILEDQKIDHLDEIPKSGIWSKLQIAILPLFILALMGATFYFSGFEAGTELIKEWIIFKGNLSCVRRINCPCSSIIHYPRFYCGSYWKF
jgi:pheromone shutdown protein TraB